jgi:hypothetical protein
VGAPLARTVLNWSRLVPDIGFFLHCSYNSRSITTTDLGEFVASHDPSTCSVSSLLFLSYRFCVKRHGTSANPILPKSASPSPTQTQHESATLAVTLILIKLKFLGFGAEPLPRIFQSPKDHQVQAIKSCEARAGF